MIGSDADTPAAETHEAETRGAETHGAGTGDEVEARRDALRAAVKLGLEDIEEGRVVDLEGALDRIEAMLDELEASKRS